MDSSDFDYLLPENLIAQEPLLQRDSCKLCVVNRLSGEIEHRRFNELASILKAGDLLVLNNSRVVRARIPCVKEGSGGAVEIFLLEPPGASAQRRFRVFFKPARKAQAGRMLRPLLGPGQGAFEVIEQGGEEPGVVEWRGASALDAMALEALGVMPLPPYIKRGKTPDAAVSTLDAKYYQNIFASDDGSAAAPTAGLHFTENLIADLKKKGVGFAELTLHVGAGTFLPLKSASLDDHKMHSERYHLSPDSIRQIQEAKNQGCRVIPVGTTSLRVLESAFDADLNASSGWSQTDIFIKPGYVFKVADALVTNFHQSKSTLLALVSAFYDREKMLNTYKICIDENYRFLSYGDAMFIV